MHHIDWNGWAGALICLYQLVKNYEYKKADERTPLTDAMNLLLPMLYQLMVNLMENPSEQSVALQKNILKIYHALTQVCNMQTYISDFTIHVFSDF